VSERYLLPTGIREASADLAVGFQRRVVLRAPDPADEGRILPLAPGRSLLVIGR
jgi:hypothetical protein